MNQLKDLKNAYEKTEVPGELDHIIKKTIRRHHMTQITKKILLSAATIMLVFTGSINLHPSVANAMSNVPGLASVVQVLSFRYDVVENDSVHANIEAPVIEGLDNKELEDSLNTKYLEESQELYDEFMEEMGDVIAADGHLGVDSGYEVITDTKDLLSIGRYTVNTVGSSKTTITYDTIDKKNGVLLTLPSLFMNDEYVERLSGYLEETMIEKMKENEELIYWVGEDTRDAFESIDPHQSFYITPENKLVLSFDEYDVAPGYMGVVQFEIPTEIYEDLLASHVYLK